MKLAAAFFKTIRWQNLVFIVITQWLFYSCVFQPLYKSSGDYRQLFLLTLASVFIAAAGYIINDYFDLNIDQVNKPEKNVINRVISRRWALVWHLALSLGGILATALAVGLGKWYLILANGLVAILLWLYSTSFKRQLLVGNIVISLLTAWTVLILFFAEVSFRQAFGSADELTIKFFRISFLYAGFAFIISLIREAIKDVEDMEGDRRYGCKTLPIVAGVVATKIYTTVWIVVLTGALIVLQLYILQFGWLWAVIYCVLLVILPLFHLFRKHFIATQTADFARLSQLTKWIMLAGILSMSFFRLYF